MKNIVFFFLMTLLFFSCTIEKRRYFKGYHVENGRMGEWENGRMGELGSSTGSGTGEMKMKEIALEQQCAASTSNNNEKPQGGDIVIEGETSHVKDAPKPQRGDIVIADEEVMVDENIINDNKTNTEQGLADQKLIQPQLDGNVKSSKGGDVVDVGRVIFGMLSIVSFALALLFFGSAIFAIDSLVMTVLLLIGGGFALAGLVFLIIYALIKRKQSVDGVIAGEINQKQPVQKEPKSVLGMVIAFLISTALTVYLGFLIAGSESLMGLLFFATFFSVFSSLAIAFAIAAVVRWIRRNRYLKMKSASPPKDYRE